VKEKTIVKRLRKNIERGKANYSYKCAHGLLIPPQELLGPPAELLSPPQELLCPPQIPQARPGMEVRPPS
jgi:hypothetical protein